MKGMITGSQIPDICNTKFVSSEQYKDNNFVYITIKEILKKPDMYNLNRCETGVTEKGNSREKQKKGLLKEFIYEYLKRVFPCGLDKTSIDNLTDFRICPIFREYKKKLLQ